MIDFTTEYARKVYKGDIVASFLVKKQCERHLRDLKELKEYTFYPDKAQKVINFIEMLPDIKTGEQIRLAAFQKFIVGSLYGWLDEVGNRRFSKAYISMARKNGKSILVAGIALYEFLFGRSPKLGRQIYCTANAKEQAKIVWTMVRKQLEVVRKKSAAINGMVKTTDSKYEILNTVDDSIIKPLSKDTSNLDGFEPLLGILDEFHEAKDTKTMEVLESGMILQSNPLTIIISTAGFHLNGPMYKEYQYVKKLLSGAESNETYFTFVAEMDRLEEIGDQSKWIKANPLLEVESLKDLLMKNILKKYSEAVQKNELTGTLVKNFNLWQSAGEDSYLNDCSLPTNIPLASLVVRV
jgi:phage terminase large subunit-like protein